MASEFFLVLPSNASMGTHPNNTLAQYITNLPRRISLSGDWECGLTEIHYPHDWYNIRNARLMVEHAGKMETDAYFEDGYYGSAKMLVRALNDGVKGGSVKFSYDPVTQKVCVHMKGDTAFMLYGDLPDILGFGRGDGVVIRTSRRKTLTQGDSIVDLRRGFESLYNRLFEHRRTTHRRRQDCTTAANSADNRTPRGDGDGSFRPCPVHSRAESRIRQHRNRDKGRHGPTSAIRTREGDGDASL